MSAVPPSATLAIDELVRRRIADGARIVHLGFGEAGLPVPVSVRDALARAADANAYGSVAGSAAAREAAAGYFARRRLDTDPDQIVFAPGSKPLLFALIASLPGDVVLPQPSWVSYAAQAAFAGRRVVRVPVPAEAGGVPDPERLARVKGPGILVLTLPDNPTGTVAAPELLREVVAVAERNDLVIVADEIYRDLSYDGVLSPAELAPERTFVTNGLSKSMALGGWRIGFARFPASELGDETRHAVTGIASEVWSSLAAPMQHVAAHVLAEPDDIVEHVRRSRVLHRATTTAFYETLVGGGALCRPPGGAFYLYPDFEPLRDRFGVAGADELATLLLEKFDIAVLTGTAFGDDPLALRFRLATSLLYGSTDEERLAALASDDPASLQRVREALAALDHVLSA